MYKGYIMIKNIFGIICITLTFLACDKPDGNEKENDTFKLRSESTLFWALGKPVRKFPVADPKLIFDTLMLNGFTNSIRMPLIPM